MRPTLLRPACVCFGFVSGPNGPPLCRCDLSSLTTKRVPGDVGFILMTGMSSYLPLRLELGFVVDRLARGETNVGLLEVLGAAERLAEAARLAGLVHDVHIGHLHAEHEL